MTEWFTHYHNTKFRYSGYFKKYIYCVGHGYALGVTYNHILFLYIQNNHLPFILMYKIMN